MTAEDRPAFAEAMAVLAETFAEPLSRVRVEAYFDALSDLPLDGLVTAMRMHARTSRWFPKPAEIRAQFPSTVPDAGAAFAALCQAMAVPAAYHGRPALPGYLATAVERMGGWLSVSRMDRDTLHRRFLAVYEPVRAAEVVRTADARQPPVIEEAPRRDRLADVRKLLTQVGRPA